MLFIVTGWRVAEAFRPKPAPVVVQTAPTVLDTYADEADSDGDTVPDWQEMLLGTDPYIADKDKANAALAASARPTTNSEVSMPETSKLVDRVVTAYVGAQTANRAMTPQEIANQISSGLEAPGTYKPHLASEIKTTNTNTKESAATYQAGMREAMQPMLSFKNSEIELVGRYVSQKDTSALAALDAMADTDDAVAKNMLKIVVPTEALAQHLEAINALTYFAATLHTMVKYAQDPVASLTLLRVFNDAEKRMNAAYGKLGNYYSQMRTR